MTAWNAQLKARNLSELFAEQLHEPQRIFARCDDGRQVSIGAFWEMAGTMAARLQATGAKPGDRVAVQVDKSIEALALFWACVRGGFVFLPLNTAYTADEVQYFLDDAEATVFVTSPKRSASVAGQAPSYCNSYT